jgi:hypothetical protein
MDIEYHGDWIEIDASDAIVIADAITSGCVLQEGGIDATIRDLMLAGF